MITIRNDRLFRELKQAPEWNTLFTFREVPGYPGSQEPTLKDPEVPVLAGGLDRIEVKARGVYFYDRGASGRDNSFVIRPG